MEWLIGGIVILGLAAFKLAEYGKQGKQDKRTTAQCLADIADINANRPSQQPYSPPRVAMGQAPGSCSGAACGMVSQTEFERRRDRETAERLWVLGGEELQAQYAKPRRAPIRQPVITVYPPEPRVAPALPSGNRQPARKERPSKQGQLPEGDTPVPLPEKSIYERIVEARWKE